METLLITGAGTNGVTGKRIKAFFEKKYEIMSPGSSSLDLCDLNSVNAFFLSHKIDYVIHCATFREHSTPGRNLLDTNLRMFYNLSLQSSFFKKMINLGSGAEYDKRISIVNVTEDLIGQTIPTDHYGFSKYIINEYISKSSNIFNLRLFGTINPHEKYNKNFVSNICAKTMLNIPLTIRQNCKFSFIDIDDLAKIIEWFLSAKPLYRDYNIVSPQSYHLSDLTDIVNRLVQRNNPVSFLKVGYNLEYTGSPKRLVEELGCFEFTDMAISVKKVFDYYRKNRNNLVYDDVKLSI